MLAAASVLAWPSDSKSSAAAKPMPRDPPVTKALEPFRSMPSACSLEEPRFELYLSDDPKTTSFGAVQAALLALLAPPSSASGCGTWHGLKSRVSTKSSRRASQSRDGSSAAFRHAQLRLLTRWNALPKLGRPACASFPGGTQQT